LPEAMRKKTKQNKKMQERGVAKQKQRKNKVRGFEMQTNSQRKRIVQWCLPF